MACFLGDFTFNTHVKIDSTTMMKLADSLHRPWNATANKIAFIQGLISFVNQAMMMTHSV